MFLAQTAEDFVEIEASCRQRIFRPSFLTVHGEGISARFADALASRIRDRVLQETISALRHNLFLNRGPGAPSDAVSVEVGSAHLSSRLPAIIREESQKIFGGDPQNHVPRKALIHTESGAETDSPAPFADERSMSWVVGSGDGAPLSRISFDPGGDMIGSQDMWDNLAHQLQSKYGSPVPWKPAWRPPPDDSTWVFAVQLDDNAWNWARLTIGDGGSAINGPLAANEMELGLANDTDWAKELWYWNTGAGPRVRLYKSGVAATPSVRTVAIDPPPYPPNSIPSLIFKKPGVFGIWHDVGHFPLYRTRFFEFFSGTRATFTWIYD
ncbi:hypothetical protein [Streptosporangium sp. CA-115845]|uniref:hypothetical protein n=1 Tax=Streptosporangium sp. CA-115845 TaxID=3240071 RepID=UPI003D8DEDDD